jgi:iron(III) transport system permease protein
MAMGIGRSSRLRAIVLGVCVALFALPPSLSVLGFVQAAASGPAWLDWVMRSRTGVCIVLGLRLSPVAMLIVLRSWGTIPTTWTQAAAVHGVSTSRYTFRVLVPHLLPGMGAALLLVALLATADVGSVLLLHPPGQDSLPLKILTVMANAPESLVASLCLVHLSSALGILALLWFVAGGRRR